MNATVKAASRRLNRFHAQSVSSWETRDVRLYVDYDGEFFLGRNTVRAAARKVGVR